MKKIFCSLKKFGFYADADSNEPAQESLFDW